MKKAYLLIVFSLLVSMLSAQTTTSYYCDFEDAAENAQWHLNFSPNPAADKGASSLNKWFFGAAGSFGVGSTQGLYVADVTTPTVCSYTATNFSGFQVSYRDLTLARGTYIIQFDWKALGQANDELIVLWVPSTQNVACNHSTTDQALPTGWSGWNKAIHLRGKANWQSYTGQLDVTSNGGKLVVMWYNKRGVATIPGGAIDNIRIYQGQPCQGPTSIAYNMNTQTLTWVGKGTDFDVLVYNHQSQSFSAYQGLTQRSMTVPNLTQEGMYYFYVRSNCGDSLHTSDWVYCNQFVWIPGARCLDFMDLDGATCYRGPFDNVTGGSGMMRGKVDQGYESVNSFHTLHYVPGEKDPRTNNKLLTFPAGEVASVRLGNWRADNSVGGMGAGEAIEYKYRVRGGMSDIMEIHYAVVMEKPGHNDGTDPHFLLEILDQNGKQIGGAQMGCYKADFAASSNNPAALIGWTELQPEQLPGVEGVGYSPIIWKPWTLISVSLRNYVGQTLTIRFTTMDCRQSAHWAYAYFTIGCRSGELQGIACGDYSTDHFDAPLGFDYRWYWEGDPTRILGTGSRFDISPTTDSVYVVDVISKTAGGCYYSLTANPNPRYPKAIATAFPSSRNCENKVVMQNDSRVYFINRKTGQGMSMRDSEPVESVFWDWGDGSPVEESVDATVEHVYPATGGIFTIKTVAVMSDGVCTDTLLTDVSLPNILSATESDDINLCRAETPTYTFSDGTVIDKDTTYYTYGVNRYGCEVPLAHNIFFHDSVLSVKDTSFCEGGYIDFEGTRYTETGVYSVPLKTIHGCDSVLTLNLSVIDRLTIQAPDTIDVCADEQFITIPYSVLKGHMSAVQVTPDSLSLHRGFLRQYSFDPDSAISIPTPEHLHPGYYTMMLDPGSPDCPADPSYVVLRVRYASSVIDQKNDIVALLNAGYNGGYEWVAYQWYRNDVPLPWATTSYVIVSDADQGAEYYCVVTLADGLRMPTCPIIYTKGATDLDAVELLDVHPTLVKAGETISLGHGGDVCVFDALGRLVYSDHTSPLLPSFLSAPSVPGMYLIRVGQATARIIVR